MRTFFFTVKGMENCLTSLSDACGIISRAQYIVLSLNRLLQSLFSIYVYMKCKA